MEVDDNDELIRGTRLVEQVLHIAKADVHLVALLRDESDTVRVDLKSAGGLATNKIWSDDQVVEDLLATAFDELELLKLNARFVSSLSVTLLFLFLELFDALFDLLGSF